MLLQTGTEIRRTLALDLGQVFKKIALSGSMSPCVHRDILLQQSCCRDSKNHNEQPPAISPPSLSSQLLARFPAGVRWGEGLRSRVRLQGRWEAFAGAGGERRWQCNELRARIAAEICTEGTKMNEHRLSKDRGVILLPQKPEPISLSSYTNIT